MICKLNYSDYCYYELEICEISSSIEDCYIYLLEFRDKDINEFGWSKSKDGWFNTNAYLRPIENNKVIYNPEDEDDIPVKDQIDKIVEKYIKLKVFL